MDTHLVLFKRKNTSLMSVIISYLAGSCHSHAALLRKGVLYDLSEKRGSFSRNESSKLLDRDVEIYKVDIDTNDFKNWLIERIDTEYEPVRLYKWILYFIGCILLPPTRKRLQKHIGCFSAVSQYNPTIDKGNIIFKGKLKNSGLI